MTPIHPITESIFPGSPDETLPTMYDLPSESPEEPGLPDDYHTIQAWLLNFTFIPVNCHSNLVYSASDLNLYYDLNHPLWYKRPDWFGVVGIPPLYQGRESRLSYVTWQEKVNPFVVVELLSPGTEEEDLGETTSKEGKPPTKWEVYETILKIPYYVIFNRYTDELQGFHLVGDRYEQMNFTDGRLALPELGLSLGLWYHSYRSLQRQWLRWFTLSGELIPIPEEETQQARQEAEQAKQRAEAAERRAELLAERLRQLGLNPDDI